MYEDSKIIAMARSMGKMLQTEPEYLNFHLACRDNDADEALQELIGRFNMAQMNLDAEMKKQDADREKIEKYSAELDATYEAVMGNEHMQAYQRTRQALEGLMQYVNNILVTAMNGGDPNEVTEPTGCDGNCGSCGGCHEEGDCDGGCGGCEGCGH